MKQSKYIMKNIISSRNVRAIRARYDDKKSYEKYISGIERFYCTEFNNFFGFIMD